MRKLTAVLVASLLVLAAPAVLAEKEKDKDKDKAAKAAQKKSQADAMAQEALDELFENSEVAKELYDKAYGFAVFSNLKIALGVSGGGGSGVAVEKDSGKRTYMKMGTAGLSVGLGGQKYQLVFLFENNKTFGNFVEKGWEANAQANIAAGTKGANAATTFTDGLAVFQLTDKGLMLQADLSGTKYWKNKRLNK